MVVDRYTKIVLTVIAVCLVYQCLLSMGNTIEARTQAPSQSPLLKPTVTPVVIVGWGEMTRDGDVSVFRDATLPVPVKLPYSQQSPLSVAVESAPALPPLRLAYDPRRPLPVAINGVRDTSGEWDAINSHVEPQAMGATPGPPRP
jgi:hypothetical protein